MCSSALVFRAPCLIAFVAAVALAAEPACQTPEPPAYATRATVERIVDGDTLEVQLADRREERIRLIGTDTPEAHAGGAMVADRKPDGSKNAVNKYYRCSIAWKGGKTRCTNAGIIPAVLSRRPWCLRSATSWTRPTSWTRCWRCLPRHRPPHQVPPDASRALVAANAARGLAIDARTGCPSWEGERLDLGWAIGVLHPAANPGAYRPAGRAP